jgi:tetratricopeptide (TPR) repeat protein|tara:strand:- start:4088 stop:4888 length:801 start_codon:yes stop_codon:yes gene_type:complete
MKRILLVILFVLPLSIFSQEDTKALQKGARAFAREGNDFYNKLEFTDAEVAYRKALEKDPSYEVANYNLGLALSLQKRGDEALAQYELVAKTTTDKITKSETLHNIGNTHFDKKDYAKSVEAYKNSLRNNPKDDETRYNLALAQELLEDQQQNQDKNDNNKDNKDDQKDQDKDQENKDDQKDKKDNKNKEDKKDGDDEKDKKEGQDDPKENKDQQDNQQQPSQPGKLSPQRIQQLLEAMNNEEKKTQEKMNARKEKGQKIKQEKDW